MKPLLKDLQRQEKELCKWMVPMQGNMNSMLSRKETSTRARQMILQAEEMKTQRSVGGGDASSAEPAEVQ